MDFARFSSQELLWTVLLVLLIGLKLTSWIENSLSITRQHFVGESSGHLSLQFVRCMDELTSTNWKLILEIGDLVVADEHFIAAGMPLTMKVGVNGGISHHQMSLTTLQLSVDPAIGERFRYRN